MVKQRRNASNRPKLADAMNTVKYHLQGNTLLIAGMTPLFQGQMRVPTPNLIHHQPNPQSSFWRSEC
jgi:hypothetical protein